MELKEFQDKFLTGYYTQTIPEKDQLLVANSIYQFVLNEGTMYMFESSGMSKIDRDTILEGAQIYRISILKKEPFLIVVSSDENITSDEDEFVLFIRNVLLSITKVSPS